MKTHTKIQKWGNSLAIRLTGAVKEVMHLEAGMDMEVEATEMYIKLYLKPKHKKIKLRFSENDLLDGLTSYTAHADEVFKITDREFEN